MASKSILMWVTQTSKVPSAKNIMILMNWAIKLRSSLLLRVHVVIIVTVVSFIPSTSHAAEMLYMKLWKENSQYHLRSSSTIKAPPELIFNVLVDYNNFYRLSGGIKETRYLQPDPDGTPVAFTLVESCVLFFCKQVKKTDRVIIKSTSEIVLEADPARSDFKFMRSRWTIKKYGKQSLLTYDMDMQPDFWIPPLIGTWALERKLHTIAINMAQRLEEMAATGTSLSDFKIK